MMFLPTSKPGGKLTSVHGTSLTDVYAVGDRGEIVRHNGIKWTKLSKGTTVQINAVWGESATNIWAVGNAATVLHFDGSGWTKVKTAATTNLTAVHGVGKHVYVAGGGVHHYDGSKWSPVTTTLSGEQVNDLWVFNPGNVVMVTSKGAVFHGSFTSRKQLTKGSAALHGIWASSAGNIIAVGDKASFRYSASNWTAMTSPLSGGVMTAVWGFSPSKVYAVMKGGGTVSYNNNASQAWGNTMQLGITEDLNDVWGVGTKDLFFVGAGGAVYRYDTKKTKLNAGTGNALYGIWGTSLTDLRAVGANGTILRYKGP